MYFYPREQQFLLVSDSFIKPQKKTTTVQIRKSSSALACHHLISELLLILWLAIKTAFFSLQTQAYLTSAQQSFDSVSRALGMVLPCKTSH